jgi:hypothetical protein
VLLKRRVSDGLDLHRERVRCLAPVVRLVPRQENQSKPCCYPAGETEETRQLMLLVVNERCFKHCHNRTVQTVRAPSWSRGIH